MDLLENITGWLIVVSVVGVALLFAVCLFRVARGSTKGIGRGAGALGLDPGALDGSQGQARSRP